MRIHERLGTIISRIPCNFYGISQYKMAHKYGLNIIVYNNCIIPRAVAGRIMYGHFLSFAFQRYFGNCVSEVLPTVLAISGIYFGSFRVSAVGDRREIRCISFKKYHIKGDLGHDKGKLFGIRDVSVNADIKFPFCCLTHFLKSAGETMDDPPREGRLVRQ